MIEVEPVCKNYSFLRGKVRVDFENISVKLLATLKTAFYLVQELRMKNE